MIFFSSVGTFGPPNTKKLATLLVGTERAEREKDVKNAKKKNGGGAERVSKSLWSEF